MQLIDTIMKMLDVISRIISVISVSVVVYGTFIAFFKFIFNELNRFRDRYTIHQLRVLRADLGTYLLLGLELLIASDICKTIVEPGTNELIVLGGIVVLRTLLSYFLDREIRLIEMEGHEAPQKKN